MVFAKKKTVQKITVTPQIFEVFILNQIIVFVKDFKFWMLLYFSFVVCGREIDLMENKRSKNLINKDNNLINYYLKFWDWLLTKKISTNLGLNPIFL